MSQNRVTDYDAASDNDDHLRDRIDRHRFASLTVILVGLSQVLLTFSLLPPENAWYSFVIGGGLLLVSIGLNAYRRKEPLQGGLKSERAKWIGATVSFVAALVMITSVVWITIG